MMSLNQKIENIEKNHMVFLGLKMTILKFKKNYWMEPPTYFRNQKSQ